MAIAMHVVPTIEAVSVDFVKLYFVYKSLTSFFPILITFCKTRKTSLHMISSSSTLSLSQAL